VNNGGSIEADVLSDGTTIAFELSAVNNGGSIEASTGLTDSVESGYYPP